MKEKKIDILINNAGEYIYGSIDKMTDEQIQEIFEVNLLAPVKLIAKASVNMKNKKWEFDFSPIEADGESYVDRIYSKAYLRHLFHSHELLAMQIASIHNLAFYLRLVQDARTHIEAGDFVRWKASVIDQLGKRI